MDVKLQGVSYGDVLKTLSPVFCRDLVQCFCVEVRRSSEDAQRRPLWLVWECGLHLSSLRMNQLAQASNRRGRGRYCSCWSECWVKIDIAH